MPKERLPSTPEEGGWHVGSVSPQFQLLRNSEGSALVLVATIGGWSGVFCYKKTWTVDKKHDFWKSRFSSKMRSGHFLTLGIKRARKIDPALLNMSPWGLTATHVVKSLFKKLDFWPKYNRAQQKHKIIYPKPSPKNVKKSSNLLPYLFLDVWIQLSLKIISVLIP